MVVTRGLNSTLPDDPPTTQPGSSRAPQKGKQPAAQPTLVSLLQFMENMEQRFDQRRASIENGTTNPTSTVVTTTRPPPTGQGSQNPQNPQPPQIAMKDPRDQIKQADVPKFDGMKNAGNWILDFTKYCRLIRISEDDHILIAFAVAMTEKASIWWEHAEKSLPNPSHSRQQKQRFCRNMETCLSNRNAKTRLRSYTKTR